MKSSCGALLFFVLASPLASLAGQNAAAAASQNAQSWDPQQILRTETFVKPPADVERMIMAPRVDISFTSPSPDRSWFLRTVGDDRGDIMSYGKPHIYLAGLQVDPKANRARALTTSTRRGLTLINPQTGATRTISTPAGATLSAPVWSPTGGGIAFIANFDNASYAYVADVASGRSTRVSSSPLLATLVTSITYSDNGKQLYLVTVPDGRGSVPVRGRDGVADGPLVRLTESRAVPQPVHASLLEDPFDKARLRYYSTGQLAVVDVSGKGFTRIGSPRMIRSIDPAPDGSHILVTVMSEPFSYLVPISAFGSTQELWDSKGKLVTTISSSPLREGAQADGAGATPGARGSAPDTSRRSLSWNPAGPGLVYLQSIYAPAAATSTAAAGGRAGRAGGAAGAAGVGAAGARTAAGRSGGNNRPQPTAVRYVRWTAPFGPNDTTTLYRGGPSMNAVVYSDDSSTMFVSDSGFVTAVRVGDLPNPDQSKQHRLPRGVTMPAGGGFGGGGGGGGGFGRGGGSPDSSNVTGQLLMTRAPGGQQLVVLGSDQKTAVVSGVRSPGEQWYNQGPRPWVDKLDMENGTRTRVFESASDAFEEFVTPLDDNLTKFIFTRESPTVVADAWVRDVTAGTTKQLTHNVDVAPDVSGAISKRLQVTRPRDGARIWVDVTLPKDWKPGTRLPGIIWFYPREYSSTAEYERSRYSTNINRFQAVPSLRPASSTRIWASQGYALIEPDIPIFGDSGRMNDNYTRDLKENLDAVLDAVVDAGYVDRNKMGIGGHSYGAFSTVNAMTLVPYFKAGIAGDGMYNRSLTPFGFQSERRNFFEAQDMYLDMSPFYRADKIAGALLMYHALEDQNQGTAPMSSTRMMAALQGLGKPAALYMYPYEDHSDATYATDLDLWARWLAWFDVYVKNAKPVNAAIVP